MLTPEEQKRVEDLMAKAVADLREAGCEAVQIIACYRESGSTAMAADGAGNWYARMGMMREILEKKNAKTLAKAIAEERE